MNNLRLRSWAALAIGSVLVGPPSCPAAPATARELASGVYVMGSSDRFGSANMGFVAFDDHVVMIGAPHPELVQRCMTEVEKLVGKPIRSVILTHVRQGERESLPLLARSGLEIVVQREAARSLAATPDRPKGGTNAPVRAPIREFTDRLELSAGRQHLEVIALGHAAGPGDAAVYVRQGQVLFTGESCVHGPRAELAGSHTAGWIRSLQRLHQLSIRSVVPGFGTWGGPAVLDRQERFLRELRRQVGHLVAQGVPLEGVVAGVRIEPEWLVWMPYDEPMRRDVEHVYGELTAPRAPFANDPFPAGGSRPRVLALIADRPHEPGHLEEGLGPAFERAGVDVRFAVDVRALTAENLRQVRLLVILRDGALWPGGPDKPTVTWMTPEQERAVVAFVEAGGGLLALHNATGLYPDGGPYLKLVGGTYQGHGPLERFRVRVLDRSHPVTRDVAEFEAADEQHTPAPDSARVHLLLESRSDEGVIGAAGWAYQAGRGRVCYLANGHTRDALAQPEVQKLLRNGIHWCLGPAE